VLLAKVIIKLPLERQIAFDQYSERKKNSADIGICADCFSIYSHGVEFSFQVMLEMKK